jgi:beta-mannanase
MRPPPRHCRQPARSPRRDRRARAPEPRGQGTSSRLLTVSLAAAVVCSLLVVTNAASVQRTPLVQGLAPTALLGAYVQPRASYSFADQQAAVTQLENHIDRRLAIDHTYVPWGSGLGKRPAWDVEMGRIPLITIGSGADTSEIAQGRHDVYLRQLAEAVRHLGNPVFIRYAHRMDLATASSWVGSPEEFVAAWRHVRNIFSGLPVSWVWTPTAAAFANGSADQFYPGDRYVDWIAADGFNAYDCKATGWRSLEALFGDFYAWGSSKGKPLMIAETGSVEDPANPDRKAAWFDAAARALATEMPKVQALIYFDAKTACDWRVDSSAASLAGFRRLALHPHFQTTPPSPTTSTTSPTTTTTTRPTTTTAPPTTTTTAPQPPPSLSSILVPDSGALWGTTEFSYDWEARQGRKFDIVHSYHQWADAFPTAAERDFANGGRILLLNWKPPPVSGSWAEVAGGKHDAQIMTTANRLKSFGRKMFLAFHHEPEDNVGAYGSATDYARAFRHIHDVFDRVGASNVIWVWNVMGYMGWQSMLDELYPGDQYVDWIAYDPYNWYGCRAGAKPQTFAEITKPFYDWTAANHSSKPLMLAEFGLREQPDGSLSKGAWLRDAVSTLRTSRTRIKAVVYFNTLHGCDWRVASSSGAVEGYRAAGQDPYLNRLN